MKELEYVSNSEAETIDIAQEFAKKLNKKDVIVLNGELGSGKTKFTQGILKHFGLENEISSPTFTIVNEHNAKDVNIYHFDVYRLGDIDEFYAIGGDEYFENGISIIEWGEIIKEALPEHYYNIIFEKSNTSPDYRKIIIQEI